MGLRGLWRELRGKKSEALSGSLSWNTGNVYYTVCTALMSGDQGWRPGNKTHLFQAEFTQLLLNLIAQFWTGDLGKQSFTGREPTAYSFPHMPHFHAVLELPQHLCRKWRLLKKNKLILTSRGSLLRKKTVPRNEGHMPSNWNASVSPRKVRKRETKGTCESILQSWYHE